MKPVVNFNKTIESTYEAGPQITILQPEATHMFLKAYFPSDNPDYTQLWVMDVREYGKSEIPYVILATIWWKAEAIQYSRIRKGTGKTIDKSLQQFRVQNMAAHFTTPTRFFELVTGHVKEIWRQFIDN